MTDKIDRIFALNREWARQQTVGDPNYFRNLARQQKPDYLWIGCSDSRVSADRVAGLRPGEVFVHRNVANQVIHTDLNCLSVMDFAIGTLQVEHIMVVGHYGCGGIHAVLSNAAKGLVESWLGHVRDIRDQYADWLHALPTDRLRSRLLCELNIIEQVRNVAHTGLVTKAWHKRQKLYLHGWIYGLEDGLLIDLGVDISSPETIDTACSLSLIHISEPTRPY